MKITVSGQQMDIGSSLQEYVQNEIEQKVSKFFERAVGADVIFSKKGSFVHASIQVNEGTGVLPTIRGHGESQDAHAAFDIALKRIEQQLRKYKARIKNHRHPSTGSIAAKQEAFFEGHKYVIENKSEEAPSEEIPVIVAERSHNIDTLTVGEAVMHMELANLPALMFINKKTGTIGVVYFRHDGNISWVDSKVKASA